MLLDNRPLPFPTGTVDDARRLRRHFPFDAIDAIDTVDAVDAYHTATGRLPLGRLQRSLHSTN